MNLEEIKNVVSASTAFDTEEQSALTEGVNSQIKSFDEAIDVLKKNNIKCVYFVNLLRTFVIFIQRFMGLLKIEFKK